MDNYLKLFYIADESDSKITDVIKDIETEELKILDNQIKKEFKEKTFSLQT